MLSAEGQPQLLEVTFQSLHVDTCIIKPAMMCLSRFKISDFLYSLFYTNNFLFPILASKKIHTHDISCGTFRILDVQFPLGVRWLYQIGAGHTRQETPRFQRRYGRNLFIVYE